MEGVKIYLACPYSHPDPKVCEMRCEKADRAAAYLMACGYIVFSPISHSHPISKHLGNHLDHSFWLRQDAAWLDVCDEIHILTLDGWDKSIGVAWERGYAADKPERLLAWGMVLAWEYDVANSTD